MKFHLTETCTCFWKGLGTRASSGWFGTQRWQVVLPLPNFPSTGKTTAGICGKRGSRHHNFHSMACEQAGETTLGLLVSFPMAKKNSVLQWHTQPQFVVTGVARVDVLLHPQHTVWLEQPLTRLRYIPLPGSTYSSRKHGSENEFQKGETLNHLLLLRIRIKVIYKVEHLEKETFGFTSALGILIDHGKKRMPGKKANELEFTFQIKLLIKK